MKMNSNWELDGRILMKKIAAERVIFNIVLIVLGVVLSMMVNVFKGLYGIILPIHIPVIIAGLLLGPISGINVAVFTPIFSNIFCGFPHIKDLFFIIFELFCYGCIAGFLKNKNININIYIILIILFILPRVFYFGGMWLLEAIISIGDISIKSMIKIIIEQIPGMILQIIVIPPVLKKLKSGLEELYGVIS